MSPKRSKEIAARTVNQQTAKEGRAKEDPMQELTKDQLMRRAKKMDIKGRSKMSKSQLARAIRSRV